jgi:phage terminase large subunit GpA-like protein
MTPATLLRPRQELHADNFRVAVEELLREVEREAHQAFAPKVVRGTAQWAEEERILPRSSSSEGGPFRNARVPYMRGPMDALDDTRAQTVVNMKGAQVAGSTIGENWVGRTMQDDPAPMIVVWPTEKLMKRWSLKRLTPMIDDTPGLARLFARSGLRDAADSLGHKEFPNGSLDLLTARSSSDLRSISAQRIWFSEVDNIIGELAEDGDPFELARSRGETFWDYKEYLESTPTVAGASRIFDEMSKSSWNDWHMPCPHCDDSIVLLWRDGMENGDDAVSGEARFVWEKDAHGEVRPGTVNYVCPQCACLIPEWRKTWMLSEGIWTPRFPERVTIPGFHIPAFISPLISWTRIAQRFVRAQKSEARMRTFVNNICGLPYRERTNNVGAHFLLQRAEDYRAEVPAGVKVLSLGGDVQHESVHLTVWGFGAGEETWLLGWVIIEGSITRRRVHTELAGVLGRAWIDEAGKKRTISASCIDAKYLTGYVHRFCRDFIGPHGAKATPIQGKEGRWRPVIADPPVETRRRRRGTRSRVVGIDGIKDVLIERLQSTEPGPGYVHFPKHLLGKPIDPAFFSQLTAEELKTEYNKRRQPVRVWRKKATDLANEVWDTFVYAYAALVSLGPRVLQELAALAAQRKLDRAEEADVVSVSNGPTDPTPAAAVPPPLKPRAQPTVRRPEQPITKPRVIGRGVW